MVQLTYLSKKFFHVIMICLRDVICANVLVILIGNLDSNFLKMITLLLSLYEPYFKMFRNYTNSLSLNKK